MARVEQKLMMPGFIRTFGRFLGFSPTWKGKSESVYGGRPRAHHLLIVRPILRKNFYKYIIVEDRIVDIWMIIWMSCRDTITLRTWQVDAKLHAEQKPQPKSGLGEKVTENS
ncbi:uncharacterized protein LOC121988922 [Zingiber officinale]|uniref:uncharacterized protein LOC121988922 n=1 Tax=Zingiber officinale TaxID=94328 RepID=UPI001C4B3487|nr:uncharacterized protein LOC121988922 [Zingiber officinale]